MIWRDSLKIGVQKVDAQHKELFKRFNEFLQVVRGEEENQEVKARKIAETLNFLSEYVVVHFDSEEEIQQKYNYPGFEEHHQAHEEFKAQVADFQRRFKETKYNEDFIQEFSGRVLTWLINHVADEDQKIAQYVEGESE